KPLQADSLDMDFSTHQVAVFAADRLLVTRRAHAWPYLEARWQAIAAGEESISGPVALVAVITNRLAARYGNVLLGLEQRLDDIEDVLLDSRGDALMQELVGYNTALRKMRRILAYHVEVYARLSRHIGEHHHGHADEFRDRVEIIDRFNSLATLYQDVINDLIDGYISLNGHNLNQIMKVLTV
ncbi:MAG: hypothetical protein KDI67_14150, partial [Gammaproteobacteria bacterium]|nr:hypothetical protein [Gammaproteobacteria bacterium]